MHQLYWSFSIFILLSAFAESSTIPAAEIDLGPVTELHVMIPMRDGVRLSGYVYIPEGEGPWPVLLEQRYASLTGESTRTSMAEMAAAGYVVAGVNFRGTQESEGRYVGYRALGWGEQKDGYDIVEWLAAQPWSNGKVGTFGSSQAGYAQNFLAVTQPPHLVCQYMIDTGLSLYHEGYRIGGTTRPERFKGMAAACRVPEHNHDLMVEWYEHPTYDEYWQDEDCTRHFDKMNVPCFTIGSWFDFMCVGSVNSYIGRQHAGGPNSRGQQHLLIGPWLHGRFNKTNKFSDVNYPENAHVDVMRHMLAWFDFQLKGIDNELATAPAVQYYVMGAFDEEGAPGNIWRMAADWPVKTTSTDYYFRKDAKLTTSAPEHDADASTIKADPYHPATISGTAFRGARDARPFEEQENVLTFTTDVLGEPVEWTGNVEAELFVSSDAPDTDFIVRVSDVYPDGRSILLVDMVRRARFRDGFESEKMMAPGEIYPIKFNVGWLSQIFNKGHRIRVTVASTGAPFYEPNPNTGEPLTIATPEKQFVATNQVYHDRRYASRVIAPVFVKEAGDNTK